MRQSWIPVLCVIALLFWPFSLPAHQDSYGQVDASHAIVLRGAVVEFSLRIPHAYLHLEVENENGETVTYEIDTGTPQFVLRYGISADTFRPGDRIAVNVWRKRLDYKWVYWARGFIAADGTELGLIPPAPQSDPAESY